MEPEEQPVIDQALQEAILDNPSGEPDQKIEPEPQEDERLIVIKELYGKFVKESETDISAEGAQALIAEYEALLGITEGTSFELLKSLCPGQATFTFDQICEVLCQTPLEGEDAGIAHPDLKEETKLQEPTEEKRMVVKFEKSVMDWIETVTDDEIKKLSPEVLNTKFEKHKSIIYEIIATDISTKEMTLATLMEVLERIFSNCSFVILGMNDIARRKDEINLSLNELALAIFQQLQAEHGIEFTAELLKELLSALISNNKDLIVIDCSNELQYYTQKIPQIVLALDKDKPAPIEAKQDEEENDPFKAQLHKTIAMYESLLAQQQIQGKDTLSTEKLLDSLKQQLKLYSKENEEGKLSKEGKKTAGTNRQKTNYDGLGKRILTKEEKRARNLEEVFHFYTKNNGLANGKKTFEALSGEQNQMRLGQFSKLLSDFKIIIEKKRIKELFSRESVAGKYVDPAKFNGLLEKVAIALNKQKLEMLTKEKAVKAKILAELNEKLKKNEDKKDSGVGTEENVGEGKEPNSTRNEEFVRIKAEYERVHEEIAKLDASMISLASKSDEATIEDFYLSMEIDNPSKYRNNMEGFEFKPFFTKEKETNRIPKELIQKYKPQPKEVTAKILEEAQKMRLIQKEEKKKEIEKAPQKPPIGKKTSKPLPPAPLPIQQKQLIGKKIEARAHSKKEEKKLSKKNAASTEAVPQIAKKLTWEGLGNISYKEIKGNDDFNPENLIAPEDGDEEYAGIISKLSSGKSVLERHSVDAANKHKDQKKGKEKGYNKYSVKISPRIAQIVDLAQDEQRNEPPSIPYSNSSDEPGYKKTGTNRAPPGGMEEKAMQRAIQMEKERMAKEEKNLQRIIHIQDARIQKGLGVAKKGQSKLI